MKKILSIFGLIAISIILAFVFIYNLINVYSESITVTNDTKEKIEIGIVTFCYECNPPIYQEIHKTKNIQPEKSRVFNVWWDDEHFETPIFYRIFEDNSKKYFCAEKTNNTNNYSWSKMFFVEGSSIEEIATECKKNNIQLPQKNISTETSLKKVTTEKEQNETKQNIDVCNDPPIETDIGRMLYPIATQYENLGFIGELFTAYDCGQSRITSIFGVEYGPNYNIYTLQPTFHLKDRPTKELLTIFIDLGFTCEDENNNSECLNWIIQKNISVEDLIKLKPFYNQFRATSCNNCG